MEKEDPVESTQFEEDDNLVEVRVTGNKFMSEGEVSDSDEEEDHNFQTFAKFQEH